MARVAVVMALVAFASVMLAPAALAHAILLRSEPGDGAVLAEPPKEIRLWFSEEVAPALSHAEVLDGQGRGVGGARLWVGKLGRQGLIVVTPPKLHPGLYSVAWRALSEDDGHLQRGLVVFRVGSGARPAVAVAPRQGSAVSPLEVALRWLNLAVLAALAGAVAVAGWVLSPAKLCGDVEGRQAVRRARRRVLGWGAAATGLGLAVGVGLLVRQVATLAADQGSGAEGAVAREVLSGTRWGVLWLVREAVLLALGAVLLATYRTDRAHSQREPRSLHAVALPAAGLLVAGLALVNTLAGHAAAGPNAPLTLAAATMHLLAAGLWVGGLLAVLLGWPRSPGGRAAPAALTRACLRRFGRLALVGVGLVALSGLYYAGQEVASPDAALTTLYGRALLIKTGLFLVTGAVGLANAVLLAPRRTARWPGPLRLPPGRKRLPPRRLRRLVLAEGCLGLLVVGAAGLLGSAAPARGPEFEPATGPSPAYLSQSADDLLVTMSVRPNRPGANLFEVLIASTRRPPLAKLERVRLRFTGSEDGQVVTSPPLALVRAGRYRLSGDFLRVAGSWRIDALIERSGLEGTTAAFGWSVGSPAPARPVVVSNARLEPLLTRIAAAWLLALLAAGAWLLLRRHLEPATGGTGPRRVSGDRHQLREETP